MDDLNKHQIILLCILISFVVSIATGIMTTSLLMQAPVELTKTVNQVVEKTIDTVVPESVSSGDNTPPKQTTTTVVVNEDDSVTQSIAKNTPSIVRIHARSVDGTVDNLYGLGLVVSAQGIIASDAQYISSDMNYIALTSDGTEIPLVPITSGKNWQAGFFEAKPTKPYTFVPAILDTNDLQLGQTVISVGGDTSDAVAIGRVSHLGLTDVPVLGTSTPTHYVSSVDTDISPADNVSGAPILSLSGDVVGMSLSAFTSSKSYLPSAIIVQELQTIKVAQ